MTRSDTVFVIPLAGRDEYYLVENRQPLESDSALLNPQRVGGRVPGLLVWHIDQGKVEAEGFRTTNTVNTGAIHGVALVQADGFDSAPLARHARIAATAAIRFPAALASGRLSWGTNPRAEDNAGGFAGFMLDRIEQLVPAGAMRFRFTRRARSRIASDPAGVPVTVDGITAAPFDDILVPGTDIEVSAAETYSDGDVLFRFREWSNGQPRSFTLSPRQSAPDTLDGAVRPRVPGGRRLGGHRAR